MKFKIFTNDAGPDLYSCFDSFECESFEKAEVIARKKTAGLPSFGGRTIKVKVVPIEAVDKVFIATPKGLKLREGTK